MPDPFLYTRFVDCRTVDDFSAAIRILKNNLSFYCDRELPSGQELKDLLAATKPKSRFANAKESKDRELWDARGAFSLAIAKTMEDKCSHVSCNGGLSPSGYRLILAYLISQAGDDLMPQKHLSGAMVLNLSPGSAGQAHLENIATHPGIQGVGTAMINEAVRIARLKGASDLIATDVNDLAMGFYKHHGFVAADGKDMRLTIAR